MSINEIKAALEEYQDVEGDRCIVVLDRGWIFVGNLSVDETNTCTLRNVHNIRKWSSGGFGGWTGPRPTPVPFELLLGFSGP